jgi:glucose dehydrogenase
MGHGARQRSGFETTPIMVDGTLFLTTPFNRVIALDPETGKQRWAFDPKIDENWQSGDGLINCGLATWLDTARAPGASCQWLPFEATIDARLIALDARTGKACAHFGTTCLVIGPSGRKCAFESPSLIRKRNQTNQLQTKLLTSGPGGSEVQILSPAKF